MSSIFLLFGVGDWNRTSIESFADFHMTTLTRRHILYACAGTRSFVRTNLTSDAICA